VLRVAVCTLDREGCVVWWNEDVMSLCCLYCYYVTLVVLNDRLNELSSQLKTVCLSV